MIIESIALKDWRCFGDERKLEFAGGLNLIAGPNEAGKSTFLDGLVRAFYERHTSGNNEVQGIRRHETKLDPEVTVEFSIGGDAYRIHKRFLGKQTSILSKLKGDIWDRIAEGDRADSGVRELVHGVERGSARVLAPELRGLAQALWLLQTDGDELPKGEWAQQVTDGIGGQVAVVSESPAMRAFLDALEKQYLSWFTDTGRIKADGFLQSAETAVQRAKEDFERLRAKSRAIDDLRAEIADLDAKGRQLNQSRTEKQAALEPLERKLEAASEYESRHTLLLQTANDVQAIQATVSKQFATLIENENAILGIDEELRRIRANAAGMRSQGEADATRRTQLQSVLTSLKPKRIEIDRRSAGLQAAHNLRKLQSDIANFMKAAERIEGLEHELTNLGSELAVLRAPSADEYSNFQTIQRRLIEANARKEASAIRVQFELLDSTAKVVAEPPTDFDKPSQFLITSATAFTIDKVGKITVGGGGKSIEDLNSSLSDLETKRAEFFVRYAIQSDEDCERRNFGAARLRDRIAEKEKDLAHARKQHPKLREDLDRSRNGVKEESERAQGLEAGWEEWGGEQIRRQLEGLSTEKKQLEDDIKRIEIESEKALNDSQKLLTNASAEEIKIAGLNTHRILLEEQNGRIIREFGSRSALAAKDKEAGAAVELALHELAESSQNLLVRVTAPREQYAVALNAAEETAASLSTLANEMALRLGFLKREVGDGYAEKLAEAEDELEEKSRRLEEMKLRGEGLKLLRELIKKERRQQAMALVKPVTDLINPWLRYISNERYAEMDLGSDLLPTGLRKTHDRDPLPVEFLSRGAREQTGVLIRLALAKLIGGNQAFPVVLDDRLVNTDRIRMERFAIVLKQIADSGQMIITTCDETRYSGLGGRVIQL